ncbi:hypothetical protein [Breoghania sp. L-A4]|uniref:hypothetical protein n=1 Tax=Breoghania sp. L-A4 TaxID=2304600 RepID=UPI000E35AB4A|nr:hypothetical protein [Breoghania sp. L-A4]AXS40815.1 hypothetical protein D1F64_13090 [Breoghania sp. L-A4]
MNPQVAEIVARIRSLEDELEAELARQREALAYRVENKRVIFEETMARHHRELKIRVLRYLAQARPLSVITAPVIYSLIVPFVLLDLFVTLYQAICFPAYGIRKVRRAEYFAFDRAHLGYLNAIEKLNCAYCSYANGLLAYVSEIAARTEQYWCPIKHSRRVLGVHSRYREFVDFGDADAFREESDALRVQLRAENRNGR